MMLNPPAILGHLIAHFVATLCRKWPSLDSVCDAELVPAANFSANFGVNFGVNFSEFGQFGSGSRYSSR